MPAVQQDQSQDPPGQDSEAIARLEAALTRIAAAAGRQQDALREAELTAQTMQYELDSMQREASSRSAFPAEGPATDAQAIDTQVLAARLDALIATVHQALGTGPASGTSPD